MKAWTLAALLTLAGCAEGITASAPSKATIPIAPHLRVELRTGSLHLNTRHVHIEPHLESSVPLTPGSACNSDVTRFNDLGVVLILHWEF